MTGFLIFLVIVLTYQIIVDLATIYNHGAEAKDEIEIVALVIFPWLLIMLVLIAIIACLFDLIGLNQPVAEEST